MAVPLHPHASLPLAESAVDVHARLTADPQEFVATATGDALTALAPLIAVWGLTPVSLPAVTATATDPDAFGSVTVTWQGNEQATGWPAATGHLAVVPEPGTGCRVVFASSRSRGAELVTARLDRVHRQRVVDMAYSRFLSDLGRQLGHRGPVAPPGVARHDRHPAYVHHVQTLLVDPDELAAWLLEDRDTLAGAATTATLERSSDALAQGRFRAPAAPQTTVRAATADELGLLHVNWASDEEATGWPTIRLTLAVEAVEQGARLLVVSPRPPGHDLSLNRMDKRARDMVLREAGRHVGEAVSDALGGAGARPTSTDLVTASGPRR